MSKKRLEQIIGILSEGKTVTIRQLALLCECSPRTIQNDIEEINAVLKDQGHSSRISSIPGHGLILNNETGEELDDLFAEDMHLSRDLQIMRIAYMLANNEYVRAEELSEDLNYSKTTITDLLHDLRDLLDRYDLEIRTRPHYGMYLSGREADIRRFILENIIADEDRIDLIVGKEKTDFNGLNERIVALIRDYQLAMTDEMLNRLLQLIDLSTSRIRNGYRLEDDDSEKDSSSYECVFAGKVVDEMSSFAGCDSDDNEVKNLLRFMKGKVARKDYQETGLENEILNSTIIEIITLIKDKYGYDFGADITLFTSLSIHIAALLKRADNDYLSKNPIKDEIKASYPLAFDMATDVALLLKEKFGFAIDEHEISYIAVYLHLASERKKQVKRQLKRVLAVCPSGKSISELIAHNIREQFADYVSTVDICSYFELDEINYQDYDYIFTYKPLEKPVPLPVIEFSLSLDRQVVDKARRTLAGKAYDRPALLELTPEELFFADIQAESRQELLEKMYAKVNEHVKLSNDFAKAVEEREKAYATELENGYAFPHPLSGDVAERSFLAFAILDKPVLWKEKKVRIVMLGCIRSGESIDLQHFYRSFARLVSKKEYVVRLAEDPEYATLKDIAREIQKEI